MHPGVFFLHLRHLLPWWSPAIIAWYGTLFFWAMEYPHSHYQEMPSVFTDPPVEIISRWFGMFFWGCVIFYAMWFALPYPGTEFLVAFFGVPCVLGITGFFLFMWCVHILDFLENTDPTRGGFSKGLTYGEWELFQVRKEERDKEQKSQILRETLNPELRRGRLIVLPGKKLGKGRGENA